MYTSEEIDNMSNPVWIKRNHIIKIFREKIFLAQKISLVNSTKLLENYIEKISAVMIKTSISLGS